MNNEEEKQKIIKLLKITVLIILMIVILSVLYKIFIADDGSKLSNRYIILGNYLILQKTNTTFKQVNEVTDDILKLNYTITDGEKTINDVSVKFKDRKWYFLDKSYNEINMKNFRVATHDYSVKLADYENVDYIIPKNDNYVMQFLNAEKIVNTSSYYAAMASYDFDKDGRDEYIYTVGNYSLGETNYKQRGFIFAVKDGKITKLSQEEKPYTIMEILDLYNNNTYEIIVNKGSIDNKLFTDCYQIYGLNGSEWQLKKDCK